MTTTALQNFMEMHYEKKYAEISKIIYTKIRLLSFHSIFYKLFEVTLYIPGCASICRLFSAYQEKLQNTQSTQMSVTNISV